MELIKLYIVKNGPNHRRLRAKIKINGKIRTFWAGKDILNGYVKGLYNDSKTVEVQFLSQLITLKQKG